MDLNELQSVRDRERQTDKLQQLRESFYADAGQFIQQLRAERDRAVERADDPFDSAEVRQLSDEIKTAQQTVEAIYEKRVGKIVKAASFAAADLPAEVDGMTAEEQALFDDLVGNIKDNREHVLALLDGEDPESRSEPPTHAEPAEDPSRAPPSSEHSPPDTATQQSAESPPASADSTPSPAETPSRPAETQPSDDGVTAADAMGGGSVESAHGREDSEPTEPDSTSSEEPASVADSPAPSARDGEVSPPSTEPVDPPVRKDGGREQPEGESHVPQGSPSSGDETTTGVERQRVQILDDVETFLGFDDRDYDLEANDVVSLPETNADILLERGVAREL